MPSNLTSVSQFTADAGFTVPNDGDDAEVASVNGAFQALADRSKYLYDQLPNGLMVGGDIVDSSNGTSCNINKIECVWIGSKKYSANAALIAVGVLEGGGAFANSTQYYVYAYVSGSSIAFQISTAVPDETRTWKNGTTTHRYLFRFGTNGSGAIIPFRKHGRQYTFRQSALNAFLILLDGNATTETDVNCNISLPLLPPHARLVTLRLLFNNTDGAAQTANIRTNGDTTSSMQLSAGGTAKYTETTDIEVDSSQIFEYKVSNTNAKLTAWVAGFTE